MAAQMINVRLSRVDAQPWGLRLQGGKDFGTPLVIQKVNMGSIADQAGLNAGDSVISVNNVDVYNLRHKDAQDIIVRSGNSFDITVQRGGSTWRPHVTPTGTVPSPTPMYGGGGGGGPVNTVTKTSLAHKQPQQDSHIGCGYNNAARPFSSQNGGPVQSIVNKQYNTPVGMYSEESIAETLSAQAEVLAGGVLGVNFKKNEKVYNSAGSEVLKALQESENDPADPADPNFFWTASHAIGGHCSKSRSQTPSQLKYSGVKLGGDTPINVCTEQKSTVCQSVGSSSTSTTQMSTNNNEARTKSLSSPVPSCDECGTTIVNTKLSANTISAALNAHHPSQNGFSQNVNSNIGAPKPFGISNVPRSTGGPPMAGPKSPSSYPPSTNPSVWATQPKQPSTFASPKLTTANYNNSSNYLSNTLPRAVSKAAPDYDDEFVDEVSQTSTYNFCWPPPPEDDTLIPTATPLYIPPPGTQHIKSKQYMLKSKTKESKRNADEEEEEIWTQSASQQMTKQSKSAPELTAQNLKQHQHYMENSESYTSTSSTTATSDEYQKIYPPPSTTSIYGLTTSYGGQSQCNFYSNKSNSEFDYNSVDMELASMHQQYQQKNEYYSSTAATSKTATDYLSFSGRRSAQECSDYLTDTLTNCQIIDYINHVPLCSTSEIPPSVQSQDSIKLYDSYSQELYEAESQSKSLHLSFPPVAPQFMRQSISPVIPKYQSDSEIKSLPKANVQSFPPVLQPSSVATAQSEQPKQTVSTSEIAVSQTVPSTCSTLTSPCKSLKKVEFSNSITEFRSTKNAQEQELTKSMDCKIKELQECHPNKHLAIERKPTLPPSNIQNSTPKEWTSLMVRALTTASDKSYSISGVKFDPNKKNENSSSEDQIVIKPEEIDSKNKIEPPPINILTEKPPAGSLMSSALTTAASQPVEWIKSEGGIIPLPTETVPYMPPPISMEPIIKEDYRTKSPFVEALTIVSDRSYTPFEHDVITQLDDLPRPPKEPLHLIDALTVAPENTYGTCKSDLPVSEKFESKSIDTQWKSQNFEEVISKTTMEKPSQSAFAQVKGFRSVDPFKPRTVTLEMLQEQEQQLVKQKQELVLQQKQNVDEQQVKDHQQQLDVQQYQEGTFQIRDEALVQSHNTHTETISRKTQSRQCHMTDQNQSQSISFPPPPGVKVKSFVQSGLHIPNTIPKYQRQWYNLPSQSPVRTPEPPELKINVPLAFLDIPHEQSDSVEKPLAVNATCTSVVNESATSNIVVAAVNASVADATTVITESLTESSSISHSEMKMKEETKSLSTSETVTTANTNNLIVDRSHPITMTFQSLDLPDLNDVSVNQKRVTSSPPPPPPSSTTVFPRPHTPSSSVINKPAPTIPYYQQNLVAEKCSASESHLFDPHLNSPSPHPDRTKSPAPGPPPNPLKIQAPRIKSPTAEKSLPIYSQMNYSNVQTEYLPNYSNGTISQTQDRPFDNYQSLAESGQRTFIDRPETFEQRQTTDGLNVQMRSKEQELNEQNRSNYESSVTQQFGNTQVQRKTRVVEEFEHTQKAKNIEIRKYSGNDPSMTKSITQPQQFSITDGERKIVTKQQQSQQPYGKVFYDHGYGKTGFVNSQTRRLSANSQYKSDLANYESHFPELSSPAPSPTQFPIRNFHPILEEPKVQSYNVLLRERTPEPTTTPTAQFSTLPLQPISSCNSNTSYCPTQSATVSSTSTLSSSHHQQIQNQTYNEMDFSKSSQKQIHNDSYLSSTLTNPKTPTAAATTKTLTTPSVPPPNPSMFKGPSQLSTTTPNNNNSYPIPLPYIKSHQTANDFMQNQNALNFKPTSTSDSGFRPSNTNTNPSAVVTDPSPASAGSNKGLTFGATSAPKRGRGIINKAALPGGRIPQCGCCNAQIRGPFITALGRIWCPDHFVCVNANCRRPLQDIGFVEEKGDLYCEYCFEKYLAPPCDKCGIKIKGDCLNAIGKHFHPECFTCTYCGKLFGNSPFFLEEGQAYCENDWNELFTTKCFACGFPVEAGDRWVEALSHNYHSQCFNCTACKKNLEGQSFYAKGGRPFCKNHAR